MAQSKIAHDLRKILRARSTWRIGLPVGLAVAVIVGATFGLWRFGQLISPDTGRGGDVGEVKIQLKSSDRKTGSSAVALDDILRLPPPPPAGDTPRYDYDSTNPSYGATPLSRNGDGSYDLFRMQGEVIYQ